MDPRLRGGDGKEVGSGGKKVGSDGKEVGLVEAGDSFAKGI
jgi:hypothetical protein